jgi:hypothetical protein
MTMTLLFYWKRAWLVHSTTKNYSIAKFSVFRCSRSLSLSNKKSGGGVLIAVNKIFDVSELSTKNVSLVEHECVKIECDDFMFQLFTWLLMLESMLTKSDCRSAAVKLSKFEGGVKRYRFKLAD